MASTLARAAPCIDCRHKRGCVDRFRKLGIVRAVSHPPSSLPPTASSDPSFGFPCRHSCRCQTCRLYSCPAQVRPLSCMRIAHSKKGEMGAVHPFLSSPTEGWGGKLCRLIRRTRTIAASSSSSTDEWHGRYRTIRRSDHCCSFGAQHRCNVGMSTSDSSLALVNGCRLLFSHVLVRNEL